MFESVELGRRTDWKPRAVLAIFLVLPVLCLIWLLRVTQMPLASYTGALPPLSPDQLAIRDRLSANVSDLTSSIGERNMGARASLPTTVAYIKKKLADSGYTEVNELPYSVGAQKVSNLEVILRGSDLAADNIVVGAHYDSVPGTVGANDNASGVASVLELARIVQRSGLRKTVRFVFFVNEEPPYFQTNSMGSWAYAHQLRLDGTKVSGMISMETIGFYSEERGSQKYPAVLSLFYPSRGNFVGFVGNSDSRDLVRRSIQIFRESSKFPSEGIAAPAEWPGISWSDQWSFWQHNYPAFMITDTAVFRYPYYHTPSDTSEKLGFDKMATLVDGVRHVIETLANEP